MSDTVRSRDLTGKMLFLGTGTSNGVPMIGCDCETCTSDDPRNKRLRCSVVFGLPGGHLLVDTPPDLRTQLLRAEIGLIHATAYTHAHADHLFGLDDLRLFPRYTGQEMPIYCEPRVEQKIRQTFDYVFAQVTADLPPGLLPKLTFQPIAPGEAFGVLGARVIPIRLYHGKLGVFGFRVGNVAYCTDVNEIPPESWPLLDGLDVLVLDALRPDPHPTHFSLDEAIAAARRIGARRTLFTHISCKLEHERTSTALPAGMELAYDGLEVEL